MNSLRSLTTTMWLTSNKCPAMDVTFDLLHKQASEKLPLMYLIDSIVKNIGENYKPLFAKNLSTTFKLAFEKVDDKSKMSLYKLRCTWDEYFPLKRLHSLDTNIQSLDPNWPIKPLPAHLQDGAGTNIHINPKFIKKNESGPNAPAVKTAKSNKPPAISASPQPPPQSCEVDKIRQQLVRQQKELLDLQQKKLMLELEQTKQQLEAKQREAKHTVVKKKDKEAKVPRTTSVPAVPGLRVTLTNNKTSAPSTTARTATPIDPRLKPATVKKVPQKVTTPKKNKTEVPKFPKQAATGKKKSPKIPKKGKLLLSPDKTNTANTTQTQQQKGKPSANKKDTKKMKETNDASRDTTSDAMSIENERRKKRSYRNKLQRSPSPPPSKVARRSNSPAKLRQISPDSSVRRQKVTDPRRRIPDKENRRLKALKNQTRDSPRSSEGSLSPRFSPEPDTDDSPASGRTAPSGFQRNDGLRRRQSFDPDLHIPKELTLSHQNEILRQADNQLNTGQLTHKQHQELLKQLHQLFEMQRFKKMEMDEFSRHDPRKQRGHSPVDPHKPNRRNIDERARFKGQINRPHVHNDMTVAHAELSLPDHQTDPRARKNLPQFETHKNHPRFKGRPPFDGDRPGPPSTQRHFRPNRSLPSGPNLGPRPRYPQQDARRIPPPRLPAHNVTGPPFAKRHSRESYEESHEPDIAQLSPPRFLKEKIPENAMGTDNLSPPPFLRSFEEENRKNSFGNNEQRNKNVEAPVDDGKQKNIRKYAHEDAAKHKEVDQKSDPRKRKKQNVDSRREAKEGKRENIQDLSSKSDPQDAKPELEEPEDYIIANMPSMDAADQEHNLEEPEDYIIAGMRNADRKSSCEEPEDFIIAGMPPGAEEHHQHSIKLKRNSESEKAYLDHLKKINHSKYTKQLRDASRKESVSDTPAEESASEATSTDAEPLKKSEDALKSPPLPLKKRRYISSELTKPEKKETTDSSDVGSTTTSSDETLKAEKESKEETEKKEESKDDETPPDSQTGAVKTTDEKEVVENVKKDSEAEKELEVTEKSEQEEEKASKSENEKLDDQFGDNSLVYIIDNDEDSSDPHPSRDVRETRDTREHRMMRGRRMGPRPKDWHHENDEEARIQRMMEDEQIQLEWEDNLHRELEKEHWKEERMRRERRGRGRGRFSHPDRWESPPHDVGEPVPFDIARGKIRGGARGRLPRPRPIRPELRRPERRGHPYPPGDRRPLNYGDERDELRNRLPPGDDFRGRPSEWELRRGRSPPPERRLPPPPPRRDPREDRPADWDRPIGRLPPREPPFHPDRRPFHPEGRRSPVEHRHVVEQPASVPASISQVNVNKLLSELMGMGIIPGSKKSGSKSASPVPPQNAEVPQQTSTSVKTETAPPGDKKEESGRTISPFIEEDLMTMDPDAQIPDITLSSDLKIRHDEIIKRLYTGIQCSACGLRFTTRQTDLYADHLDWHYRLNRKDKEGGYQTHRDLYPSAGEWICYEEIENPQERSKNPFFDESENTDGLPSVINTESNDLTVPLTGQPGEDSCKVCKEAFETFYNETDDEWQFANCVRVDNDNFHPNCYGDHYDATPLPTPIKPPTYNPLESQDGIPGLNSSDMNEEEENTVMEEQEMENKDIKREEVDDSCDVQQDVASEDVCMENEANGADAGEVSNNDVVADENSVQSILVTSSEDPHTGDDVTNTKHDVINKICSIDDEIASVPSVANTDLLGPGKSTGDVTNESSETINGDVTMTSVKEANHEYRENVEVEKTCENTESNNAIADNDDETKIVPMETTETCVENSSTNDQQSEVVATESVDSVQS